MDGVGLMAFARERAMITFSQYCSALGRDQNGHPCLTKFGEELLDWLKDTQGDEFIAEMARRRLGVAD